MNPYNFRKFIIRPALEHIELYSPAAENLLLGTAAQESKFNYLKQVNGIALGYYQCEPATYKDQRTYLSHRSRLKMLVDGLAGYRYIGQYIPATEIVGNLFYATAIARVHYFRKPEALPEADDIRGLGEYWKEHYNTRLGAGTVEQFIESYEWAQNKSNVEG